MSEMINFVPNLTARCDIITDVPAGVLQFVDLATVKADLRSCIAAAQAKQQKLMEDSVTNADIQKIRQYLLSYNKTAKWIERVNAITLLETVYLLSDSAEAAPPGTYPIIDIVMPIPPHLMCSSHELRAIIDRGSLVPSYGMIWRYVYAPLSAKSVYTNAFRDVYDYNAHTTGVLLRFINKLFHNLRNLYAELVTAGLLTFAIKGGTGQRILLDISIGKYPIIVCLHPETLQPTYLDEVFVFGDIDIEIVLSPDAPDYENVYNNLISHVYRISAYLTKYIHPRDRSTLRESMRKDVTFVCNDGQCVDVAVNLTAKPHTYYKYDGQTVALYPYKYFAMDKDSIISANYSVIDCDGHQLAMVRLGLNYQALTYDKVYDPANGLTVRRLHHPQERAPYCGVVPLIDIAIPTRNNATIRDARAYKTIRLGKCMAHYCKT
jgi:hypothetical protein